MKITPFIFMTSSQYYILSIAIAGLDSIGKPILLRQNPNKYNNIKCNYNQIINKLSICTSDQINTLVILPLHPNRVNEITCFFDEQFRFENDDIQNTDLMDEDEMDLFNEDARDEYDLDEDEDDI